MPCPQDTAVVPSCVTVYGIGRCPAVCGCEATHLASATIFAADSAAFGPEGEPEHAPAASAAPTTHAPNQRPRARRRARTEGPGTFGRADRPDAEIPTPWLRTMPRTVFPPATGIQTSRAVPVTPSPAHGLPRAWNGPGDSGVLTVRGPALG